MSLGYAALRSIALAFVFCWLTFPSAIAQNPLGRPIALRPKVGEAIEVKFLGDWLAATVTAVNKNQVQAQFVWANGPQVRVFDLDETRYPWQARVMTPAFLWKDASGEHSIPAAVVRVDIDRKTVTLLKIDDQREITLSIEQLGAAEQKRIEILMRSANTRPEPLPPVQSFAPSTDPPAGFVSADNLAAVQPDPPAIELAVPMGGAPFAKMPFYEKLTGVFPIGSSAGWILGTTQPSSPEADGAVSRLIWATLSDGRVATQHAMSPDQTAIAVHPPSQQILALAQTRGSQPILTIYQSSPKLPLAKPMVRWTSGKEVWSSKMWGDFIDERRVIHATAEGEYTAYHIVEQRELYKITQDSFFHARPALSPGRGYFALPEDKRVRIIKAVDGSTLASLPIEGGSTSGVAFNAQGTKLAVLTGNKLEVWSLGSSAAPETFRADLLAATLPRTLAWVDDRSLLVGGEVLYSLDRQLPIWSYQPEMAEVVSSSFNPQTVSIAGGRLAYAVDLRADKGFVIGAVELPGPLVKETVDAIETEWLFALRPGDAIALDVRCGEFNQQVTSALTAKAQSNNWHIASDAPIKLIAEMGRYPSEQRTYEQFNTGQRMTVTTQPFYSKVQVTRGEEILWQSSGSRGGAGSHMFVAQGESLQAKINEGERPYPEFFEGIEIPERLFDPRFNKGLGVSTYGKSGLTAEPLPNIPRS